MSNLDLWNKLGRTDPAHTKGFKRAGGFGGTAIKPIYTEQKMTEEFGPCGTGWGFSEPVFQTVPASEGQIAVYCWLSLWYVLDGKKSEPVFGVGGDMVVVKQSAGLRTDDEAFKKAFTDAIGNAMKHIGMSADVHMGLFDDSKYVQEVREEVRKAAKPTPSERQPETDDGLALYTRLSQANKKCATKAEFSALWGNPKTIKAQNSLNEDYQAKLEKEKTNKFGELEEKEPSGYQAPDFTGMEP